jgi:dUTP pyrophosphatase
MALNVYKLVPTAISPVHSSEGSSGYDLFSADSYIVLPGQRVVVSTGVSVELPPGTYGRIESRVGLAVKHGVTVGAGLVDPDYKDELKVVLFNHDTRNPFVIRPGYRIAQLILQPYTIVSVNEHDAVVEDQAPSAGC